MTCGFQSGFNAQLTCFNAPDISKNVCVISTTLRWIVTNSKNSYTKYWFNDS